MLLLAFVLHSMLVLSEACLTSVSVRLSCKEPWFLIFLHACRHVCRCHFRAVSTHAWWVPMPLESWEHTFQELFVDRPRNCTCSSGGRYFLFSQMTYVVYEITQWQFLTLLKFKKFSHMHGIQHSRANSFGTRKKVTRHPTYRSQCMVLSSNVACNVHILCKGGIMY